MFGGNLILQLLTLIVLATNLMALLFVVVPDKSSHGALTKWKKLSSGFFTYQFLGFGALLMLVPFYWMVVTSFKDGETSSAFPPVWTPSRMHTVVEDPEGNSVPVVRLGNQREAGQLIDVVPKDEFQFQKVDQGGASITREVATPDAIFQADPANFTTIQAIDTDLKNYMRAWYRPEETTKGQVNFLTYFIVSIITAGLATTGALITSAFAAFAFARLEFIGKTVLFYVILATMMVPGQVLLIPNFLILSALGMLDTYAALTVPWIASVFTIFLMRQFFMTIPEDLWDAARIDGSSRFRYLWQIVVPLSKPVFITAGIFDFLNNWNSLLWPLIVTSSPAKRTLMVGLQNLNDDAGTEFHILMAASCMAVLPIVIAFFFLQRFFIEGIARTGLK